MGISEAEAIKALQDNGVEVSLDDGRSLVEIANDLGFGGLAANETIVISPVAE